MKPSSRSITTRNRNQFIGVTVVCCCLLLTFAFLSSTSNTGDQHELQQQQQQQQNVERQAEDIVRVVPQGGQTVKKEDQATAVTKRRTTAEGSAASSFASSPASSFASSPASSFASSPASSSSSTSDHLLSPVLITSKLKDDFAALQSRVNSWPRCVDQKNPVVWSNGSSENRPNFCGFVPYLTSQMDERINSVFSKISIEAHGDSTLRELIKFLVNRFKVEASLEKSDANMTMRKPKFFVRRINASHAEGGGAQVLRIAFRFDFFGESFLEPFDKVPMIPFVAPKPVNFFYQRHQQHHRSFHKTIHHSNSNNNNNNNNNNNYANVVFLSVGSHVAKHFVMELKETDPRRLESLGVVPTIIEPIQDFIVLRCLGYTVIRTRSSARSSDNNNNNDNSNSKKRKTTRIDEVEEDITSNVRIDRSRMRNILPETPKADLIVFLMQHLECEAMASSVLQGFRKMFPFCPVMQRFLDALHKRILSDIVDVLSAGGEKHHIDARNVFSLLSKDELQKLQSRFLYLPPMNCHSKENPLKKALSPSKPHCSRDGIHMRSKFLRFKLDMALNAVVNWWETTQRVVYFL